MTVMGQLNNDDAFFNGTYDKEYIRKHKISKVIVKGFLNERPLLKLEFDFDKRGFLTKETTLDSSGKKETEHIFTYNNNGDQIERKEISYTLNKTYITTFERTYTGSQLITEKSSALPFMTKHSYNAQGQKIQSVTNLGDESNANKKNLHYNYDKKGRLIRCEETLIYGNGQPTVNTRYTTYQYDINSNLITVIMIDNTTIGNGQMRYNYKYNQNGLLVSYTTKMPEDLGGSNLVDNYSYVFWK